MALREPYQTWQKAWTALGTTGYKESPAKDEAMTVLLLEALIKDRGIEVAQVLEWQGQPEPSYSGSKQDLTEAVLKLVSLYRWVLDVEVPDPDYWTDNFYEIANLASDILRDADSLLKGMTDEDIKAFALEGDVLEARLKLRQQEV